MPSSHGLLGVLLNAGNVQAGREDNIAFYNVGSCFHFLVQRGVAHDCSSVFELSACLVQSDDGPHYHAFWDVRELAYIRKWSALPREKPNVNRNRRGSVHVCTARVCTRQRNPERERERETFAHSYTTSTRPNLRFSSAYSLGSICSLNCAWSSPSLIAVSYNLHAIEIYGSLS